MPHIIASGITMAALGDSVTLECQVDSYPEPKMIFWRDYTGRVPVIQGGKYNIKILRSKDGNVNSINFCIFRNKFFPYLNIKEMYLFIFLFF